MAEIEIMQETPLTMKELMEKLNDVKKRDKDLGFRSKKTLDYLGSFVEKKQKDDLKKGLVELGIPRLKEKHIVKIADINPSDIESLKALLVGENLTLKQEDLKRILECLTK